MTLYGCQKQWSQGMWPFGDQNWHKELRLQKAMHVYLKKKMYWTPKRQSTMLGTVRIDLFVHLQRNIKVMLQVTLHIAV